MKLRLTFILGAFGVVGGRYKEAARPVAEIRMHVHTKKYSPYLSCTNSRFAKISPRMIAENMPISKNELAFKSSESLRYSGSIESFRGLRNAECNPRRNMHTSMKLILEVKTA